MRRTGLPIALICSALPLGGCGMIALQPAGKNAADISSLFWIFVGVSAAVWLLVTAAMLLALPRGAPAPAGTPPSPVATRIVQACVGATVVVIVALTLLSYLTGKSIADIGGDDPVVVDITGYQWWWNLRYEADSPSDILTTANEIHIPAGRPVQFKLDSRDVIHSFWIPSLTGKQDLIPGEYNEITIRADKPGIYRAPCAEFCGLQHAHMTAYVVVEEPDAFAAWRAEQMKPAVEPTNDEAIRGRDVFLTRGCALCHTIAGTLARGRTGPDLTHVASRRYVATGTLPMSRGSLAAWISNPQGIKPGSNMPRVDLSSGDLNALVAYLVELK